MSPWTVLGWVLVALVVVPIAVRSLAALIDISGEVYSRTVADRKRKRADKGKLRCEYQACINIATRKGAGGYCCDEHTRTHLTNRMGLSYAIPLKHVRKRKDAA